MIPEEKSLNLRVLLVASGQSLHTFRWVNRLSRSGVDVTLYDIDSRKDLPFEYSIPIISKDILFKMYPGYLRFFPQFIAEFISVRKYLAWQNFSVVHLHWVASRSTLINAICSKSKVVATPWGSDINLKYMNLEIPRFHRFLNWIYSHLTLLRADVITCQDELQKSRVMNMVYFRKRISLIPLGTDTNFFKPKSGAIELRRKLGLKKKDFVVISTRSLEPIYDVSTLIRAAKNICAHYSNVKFIIAGDGSLTERIREEIVEGGLCSNVFLIGKLNQDDLRNALNSSNIYVSTSLSDGGLAQSTSEAMACGLPVLISNFGENCQWSSAINAGRVFDAGDHVGLASEIRFLYENPWLVDLMGANAREAVIQHHSERLAVEKFIAIYGQLRQDI